MWMTKVRDKHTFLLILKFIPCRTRDLRDMLQLVQPLGSDFYATYIANDFDFADHWLFETENIVTH